MKKLIVLFSLVVSVSLWCKASNDNEGNNTNNENATITISGKVVDNLSGEPLAGVLISVESADIKSYTDFEGNFTLNVKPGEYDIMIDYISYNALQLKDIKINESNTAVLNMVQLQEK